MSIAEAVVISVGIICFTLILLVGVMVALDKANEKK